MFEHFGGNWAYAEPDLFGELSKKFFPQFSLGPIRRGFRRFFKISIIYSQNLHFNLVYLSNILNIHAHAEHT